MRVIASPSRSYQSGWAWSAARTWKWMLPSPRWPKPLAVTPGKARSTSAAASMMKRGMSATGTEMSCARVWPSLRSASEMESRRRQNASAWASLEAIAASAMRPCWRAAPSSCSSSAEMFASASAVVASTSTCHGCWPASGERVPGMCFSTSSQRIVRNQLEPFDAARCGLRESAASRARASGFRRPPRRPHARRSPAPAEGPRR